MTRDEVVLPRMSDTMEEGSVVRWLKKSGDAVTKGEALVEVDTDKVTVVLEAPADGFLGEIFVSEGETAKVGTALALVVDEAGVVAASKGQDLAQAIQEPARTSDPTESSRSRKATPTDGVTDGKPVNKPAKTSLPTGPLRATPLARKLAKNAALDISTIAPGSGPDGRVLREDVDRALQHRAPAAAASGPEQGEAIEPSRLQIVLARRMTESKQQIPHYYVTTTVDVTDALRLRHEAGMFDPPLSLSLTDLVVYSCALTLVEFVEVNSSWLGGKIVRHPHANVGIAVALDDGGLIVPVLRAADQMSLHEIVAQSDALAERARSGRLTPSDLDHGTFTVSNLGMFGVDEFHAIINPPESGILAIGTAEERAVVRDGSVVARTVSCLSLSADHRVYSGVVAARFLNAVRTRLEHPTALCLPSE